MPQRVGPVLMVGSSVACAKPEKGAPRWTLTSGQGDNCKLLHSVQVSALIHPRCWCKSGHRPRKPLPFDLLSLISNLAWIVSFYGLLSVVRCFPMNSCGAVMTRWCAQSKGHLAGPSSTSLPPPPPSSSSSVIPNLPENFSCFSLYFLRSSSKNTTP
ncbi:hypothetical protein T01_11776 [Trichinella spiralis]|uniref:Uncharacterized protein n=1 Tax=Trichinella spiralis TaxID=6334 RepID=A0A0V1B503_TRISP|nr:hypothetical protein T01_11621 [Trichinella spiralis]KRY32144.1 hypothetical protein T01_11776 [Trichinella spiralis]